MPLPIAEDLTRIPYRLYRDEALYADEQRRLFGGPCWNFLCLEVELPNPGDFRSTFAGETPVVATRGRDGTLSAFENRCAHRGALICLEDRGNAKSFSCVYHAWTYNLCGDLVGVAFKNGIGGEGGMRPSFRLEEHGPRKLRVAVVHGLVFGTFAHDAPPLEQYLGPEILTRIGRVLGTRTPVVIGRFTQMLPNNWKLYVENVKDSNRRRASCTSKRERLGHGSGSPRRRRGAGHPVTLSLSKRVTAQPAVLSLSKDRLPRALRRAQRKRMRFDKLSVTGAHT